MTLLHVDSSILGGRSASRQLSEAVVRAWVQVHPDVDVVYRDLALTVVQHLSPLAVDTLKLGAVAADGATDELTLYEQMIGEFLAADVVVLGVPMYNFGVPSQFKTWIDALAQAGRTFKYTEHGPQGLVSGKKVMLVSTRGGVYTAPPMDVFDFQERYVTAVMKFMGVDHIDILRAEGLNMSPAQREAAMVDAQGRIAGLVSAISQRTAVVA